jgi:NADH dehydrogenase [ubiquinone] 1 alpha subcomplex assembly factor 7
MTTSGFDGCLAARLKARIADEGPIGVDAYMRACLSEEGGYYRARQPIGRAGDFITAPEISQVFGELIFVWCASVWRSMGAPSPLRLVELGSGRGALMADLLRATKALPAFRDAAQVTLIEQSETLIEVQRAALAQAVSEPTPASCPASVPGIHGFACREQDEDSRDKSGHDDRLERGTPKIIWARSLAEVPPGPAIVVANEFLDALPVRQFVMLRGAWRERRVGLDRCGHFVFTAARDAVALDEAPQDAGEGAIFETRPDADALIGALAARQEPFAALFVDYGHDGPALGDTLQAVRSHAFADPLASAGEADLTAHVDFGALRLAAARAGLAAHGPAPQRDFLFGLGLAQRMERLAASATPDQRAALEAGAARLVAPDQMGVLFKAMAVTSAAIPAPPPWSLS